MPGTMTGKARGFTLLELLVVLLIIAIMATFVTFTVGGNPVRDLEHEARKLKALVALAQQEALLSSREMAMDFESDGYSFWVLESLDDVAPADASVDPNLIGVVENEQAEAPKAAAEGEKWVALEEDETLRPRELPDDINMSITLDDEAMEAELFEGAPAVRVFILSSGEMTPFEVSLSLEDGPSYVLSGDLVGNLTLEGPI